MIHSVVSVPLSRFGKDGYGFQSAPVWDVLVILVFDRFFLPYVEVKACSNQQKSQ